MNPRVIKIARNIMFLLSVPLIISAFAFAQVEGRKAVCKGISISIQNPEISFITKNDIMQMVLDQHIEVKKTLTKDLDLTQLENVLDENKWIKSSNVFLDQHHLLTIHIEQRKPEVRIVEKDSTDYAYYLDEHANPIPLSGQYSPRLPVVTASSLGYSENELDFKSDLVALSRYIQKDTFWNAAISQLDIDEQGRIVLIPVLGTQTILFGDISDMENKFDRLLLFYKHSINKVDWTKYDELDVRFLGQVICRNHSGEVLSVDPYNKLQQKRIADIQAQNSSNVNPTTPKPSTSKPTTSKPSTSKPVTSKPTTSKLSTSKPTTSKPTTSKPTTSKPVTSKPSTSKPSTSKPETPKTKQ